VAGLKIWPLFVALGTAATATGVTVWAAYGTHGLNLHSANEVSAIENRAGGQREEKVAPAEALSDPGQAIFVARVENPDSGEPAISGTGWVPNPLPDCIAVRYARALQTRRTDEIIHMTHWMQERLKRVRLSCSVPAREEAAREELRHDILTRTLEGNRLRPEGVEDKYIFAPGARLEVIGSDKREHAHEDPLSCPVKERTWLRVVYPNPITALRDETGRPIRSIVVGVNVSPDGYVLKAGILGNVEIRRDTISLDWES